MTKPKGISRTRATVINLVFNYSSTIFTIINGLVLVPLYLKYFSLSTYGAWLATGNIIGLFGLIDGGINLIFAQRLAKFYGAKDYIKFAKIVGSGAVYTFIIFILICTIGITISSFVPSWVNADITDYKTLQLAFVVAAFAAAFGVAYLNIAAILQAWLDAHVTGMSGVIGIVIGVLTIISGLWLGLGVVALPLGILARNIFNCLFLLIALKVKWKRLMLPKITFSLFELKDLFITTLPVAAGRLGSMIFENSKLIIISNAINPAASAVFVLTGKIFQAGNSFINPLSSSIFAGMSQLAGINNIEKSQSAFKRLFTLFNGISIIIIGCLLIISHDFIIIWVGPDKYGGYFLAILIALAAYLSRRINFLGTILFSQGVIGKTAWLEIIQLVVQYTLIFLLIKSVGMAILPLAQIISIITVQYFLYTNLIGKQFHFNSKLRRFLLIQGIPSLIIIFTLSTILEYFKVSIANSWFDLVMWSGIVAILNIILYASISKIFYKELIFFLNKIYAKVLSFRKHNR